MGKPRSRLAIVTGATRGIGRACALELRAAGYFVVGLGRDPRALKSLGRALGPHGRAIACDVSNLVQIESMVRSLSPQRVSVLVNNAGRAQALTAIAKLDPAEWEAVIRVNLTGVFLLTQAVLPRLVDGATIINVLSVAATEPFVGMAAYNAAKAGALGFTNVLREELRPRRIRVTALLPGAVDTDIWQQFWPDAPTAKMMAPATIAQLVRRIVELPPAAAVDMLRVGPAAGTL